MSLKINNEAITASELSGTNEDLTYFNTSLTPLIPNSNIKLLGSPSQREQLKRMANSNIPYALNYTPKITDIVNPGDNTELFSTITESHKIIRGFSYNPNRYLTLSNSFNPQSATWEMMFKFKPYALPSDRGGIIDKSYNTWYGFLIDITSSGTLSYIFQNNLGTSSSDYFAGTGANSLILNDWNYVKAIFDGSSYRYYYSSNGQNWKLDFEKETSVTMASWSADTVIGCNVGRYEPFNGEIDMTETYIKINDEYFFNGATAVQDTDYNITGNISITEELVPVKVPSPFTFSFDLDSSAITEGTKYLIEHPNLMKVKTQNNNLYFNFPWRNNNWCNISLPKMLYAYTDGNGNTIYTPDLNLQGTFKSLNTNDFENLNDTPIDENGIATFDGSHTKKIQTINPIFNSTTPQNWKINVDVGYYTHTAFYDGTIMSTTLSDGYPNTIETMFEVDNRLGRAYFSFNNGSSNSVSITCAKPPADSFFNYLMQCQHSVSGGTDIYNYSITTGQSTSTATGSPRCTFRGGKWWFGNITCKLDLTQSWLEGYDVRTTLAKFNTTSNLYNSNFNKITPTTAEHYNNVIVVDGTTYTRDTSKDGIKNVPATLTGTTTISLVASDSQGGTTEADQVKLNVNNHNFTLVASGEGMPAITTGVLGYREELEF